MGADNTSRNRAVVIAGPTASGKSALAVTLAEQLGGVVINADSMQVYRDLRILTARPSDEDMARVPHRLFGHVDAAEAYSVGRWLAEVQAELHRAWTGGHLPIVVGGSGLYIKALLHGLSDIPPVPDDVRRRVRQAAADHAPEDLHALLAAQDPVMAARLRTTDPQRIARALEVWEATGTSLAEFQRRRSPAILPPEHVHGVFMAPDRQVLRRRLDLRFRTMVESGALAETAALAARALDPILPALQALGVSPLLAHLRGEVDLATAITRSVSLTAQYAKRQVTFGRHQLSSLRWVDPHDLEALRDEIEVSMAS